MGPPRVSTPGVLLSMATVSDGGRFEEPNARELLNRLHGLTQRDPTALPRIAIIGDTGSGKSAIFEALTGLSFPAETRPLTNFPIHAQFRHIVGEKTRVRAYISPGRLDGAHKNAIEQLERFEVTHDGPFTGDDIIKILHEAAKCMNITIADSEDTEDEAEVEKERRLSDNVLVIEITGNDVHSLNVVDFPGFMHNSIHHDVHEINAIRTLVMDYIKEPHSIILAVIDATNQIGNQEALEFARVVDPEGHRTVGVLTKCDVVQQGDEKRILRITHNKEHHLRHGWFAIKNRSMQERRDGHDLDQRNGSEMTFFSRHPWNTLDSNRIGLAALKGSLGYLTDDMLRDNIDLLRQRIRGMSEHGGSRYTESTDLGRAFDEKGGSLDDLRPASEHIGGADEATVQDPDLESGTIEKRPTMIINSITVALTIAIVMTLIGLGCQALGQELATDGDWGRLFLLLTVIPQSFVSLFFCQTVVTIIFQLIGPVSQLKKNSKFYSVTPIRRLNVKNGPLPHVTIQCPVYKEGLKAVIEPTVQSLQAAVRHYESLGGTANIFVNDDGMQMLSPEEAAERRAFYAWHNIGWVARPKHNPDGEGLQKFIRRGKFKKASNMNYALGISMKVEDKLLEMDRHPTWSHTDEQNAYHKCLSEVLHEELGRAWAEGDIRIGDYILIVDSDTRIPEECMIDAVSELEASPRVAILQFSSGVMNVTTSYFEAGITFFTELIYTAIQVAVSNGDVAPFVGHNAFLRWSSLQEVSFQDEHQGDEKEPDPNCTVPYEKFWSESHVSEDFDLSLRLQTIGYYTRLGCYFGDGFKEGVSLTVYDELARWEKYAYGCNELLFHPVKYWLTRGPFTPLFRRFISSNMAIGSKVTILSYIGTYYAIGYAWIGSLMNYFLIGWLNGKLDHYYMNSWRVWVALVVVFSGAGNLALAVVRYRGEGLNLGRQIWVCFRSVPLLFIFLGGISLHVGCAILAHMFSIDMSWGATAKEVTDTSFFIEMPLIARRFKYAFIWCFSVIALIICGVYAFPYLWQIHQLIAIFPLAILVSCHFLLPVLLNPALMKFTW